MVVVVEGIISFWHTMRPRDRNELYIHSTNLFVSVEWKPHKVCLLLYYTDYNGVGGNFKTIDALELCKI